MINYSIGYFAADENDNSFVDAIRPYAARVEEVYFPWPDISTCRASLSGKDGYIRWDAAELLMEDLYALRRMGIKLNLLLNGNCYGGLSLSERLKNNVCSALDYMGGTIGLPECVTTTSPLLAHIVKSGYAPIDVRASINMRMETPRAMSVLFDQFDSFYLPREKNYDFKAIAEFGTVLRESGKRLHMLANSGCISYCPSRIFHDNLVSHEDEIMSMRNIQNFNPTVCWTYYAKAENQPGLLSNSWVRPEDIHRYDGLFSSVKLATRANPRPAAIIRAYMDQTYCGNILDLTEPTHSTLLGAYTLDNQSFPPDYFDRRTACGGSCAQCGYCGSLFEKVKIPV